MSGEQTPSLPLRSGLKLSFFIKLIVGNGSGDPETSHSYAAIGLDCWGASSVTPFLTLISFSPVWFLNYYVHVTLLWLLTCVSLLRCLLSPLFCPLKLQLVGADGHPSWFWFCQRFLPVKRESFLSTVASCTRRTGDWTEDKFRSNLLVSLARILFLNWLNMNELDYFEIN